MNMSDTKFFEARGAVYNPNCNYARGQNLNAAQKQTQMSRARTICKSLGLKAAINYMKKHGYSAEMCVEVLLKKTYNILAGK